MILCISAVSVVMDPLLFLILFGSFHFSLLVNLAKGFVFFKKQAISFTDLFCCHFSLYFISFCSDLCSFFLLLTMGFICSFSSLRY